MRKIAVYALPCSVHCIAWGCYHINIELLLLYAYKKGEIAGKALSYHLYYILNTGTGQRSLRRASRGRLYEGQVRWLVHYVWPEDLVIYR